MTNIIHLDDAGTYQPGDAPPEGYLQWHEWASTQDKAGLRQARCPGCSLWRYPQEFSGRLCLKCTLRRHDA